MNIIAHRGLWHKEDEKNAMVSFERAFKNNIGIETDIRDYQGELVISHNVADSTCDKVDEVFKLYKRLNTSAKLALNVKADGIQDLLVELLNKHNIDNYFVFDMSIPEAVVYNDRKINYYTRNSDIENQCVLYENAQGVWVDAFYNDWDIETAIKNHLSQGKEVSLISPEIHKKDEKQTWEMLKKTGIFKDNNFYLCTDIVHEAEEFFE